MAAAVDTLLKGLGSNISEKTLLAMVTTETCHPSEYGEPVVRSKACCACGAMAGLRREGKGAKAARTEPGDTRAGVRGARSSNSSA